MTEDGKRSQYIWAGSSEEYKDKINWVGVIQGGTLNLGKSSTQLPDFLEVTWV